MTAISKVSNKIKQLYFVTPYYALQDKHGRYYPARNGGSQGTDIKITKEIIALSLGGSLSIGAYSTSRDNKCKWVCIDIDEPNILIEEKREKYQSILTQKTLAIYKKCLDFNVTPYVESSGHKGVHLFIFFENEISSEDAYQISHAISDAVPQVEAFPKQENLGDLKYGNLVRICNNINLKSKQKSVWVDVENNFFPFEDQYEYTYNIAPLGEFKTKKLIEQTRPKVSLLRKLKRKIIKKESFDVMSLTIKDGEQNLKRWMFVINCIKNGWDRQTAIDAGMMWLEQNAEDLPDLATSKKYFLKCIKREYDLEGLD
jgi:hypothetical protein